MEADNTNKYDFDYFVIGGGSGGISTCKRAAKHGKKVGIADFVNPTPQATTWGFGGTCVNVGCIPKKLMHFASNLGDIKKDQYECGWEVDFESGHDWMKMMNNVKKHIKSINWGYKKEMKTIGVKYYNALASFVDEHTIKLVDKKKKETIVTADKICIAVGGRPRYLDVEGCKEYCITSDDIFWLKKPPGKSLVIGGGYIALECGGFLKGMGKDVHILHRSTLLRDFDEEMAGKVVKYMKHHGVNFIHGNATKFERHMEGEEETGKVNVFIKEIVDGKVVERQEVFDNVLLAIGRVQVTYQLNLESIGLKTNNQGKFKVNEKWQTSIGHIHAIGDNNADGYELTPVAIKEGVYLADGLFLDKWKSIDYSTIGTTVFTPLEYSVCGLTERQATEKHGKDNIIVYKYDARPIEWNFNLERPKGVCYSKAIVHKKNRKVLGLHYVGPQAGEVIQGYCIAIRLGLTFDDFIDTCAVHPTYAEQLVNFREVKKETELIG